LLRADNELASFDFASYAYPIDSYVYASSKLRIFTCTDDGVTGEGTGNNYAYLVTDIKTKESTIIDPANPPE
jgi:hypothetical protein